MEAVELTSPGVLQVFRLALEGSLAMVMGAGEPLPEEVRGKFQRRLKAFCTAAYDDFVRHSRTKLPTSSTKKLPSYHSIEIHMREAPHDQAIFSELDQTEKKLAKLIESAVCKERTASQAITRSLEELLGRGDLPGEDQCENWEIPDVTKTTADSIKFLKAEREAKQSGLKALRRIPPTKAAKPQSLGDLQLNAFLYAPWQ